MKFCARATRSSLKLNVNTFSYKHFTMQFRLDILFDFSLKSDLSGQLNFFSTRNTRYDQFHESYVISKYKFSDFQIAIEV